tara:strand:- start:2301 stop:2981 length:681 start_codon:yes stop_codon:yes gene_type:complete
MNKLFERDFGILNKLNKVRYFYSDTNEEVGDAITVFDYYAAYYWNYMLLRKAKNAPKVFNFNQKRRKDRAFVVYDTSSHTINEKVKDRFLSKNGMGLIKIFDGDIFFDPKCPNNYNFQFKIQKGLDFFRFSNIMPHTGRIREKFCVPEYHPLYFSNVDSRYFYINFHLNSLDEILFEDETKFRHKDYIDYIFISEKSIQYVRDKIFFILKVDYVIDYEIHVGLKVF